MNDTLHIEICQRADSILSGEIIEEAVKTELNGKDYILDVILYGKDCANIILRDHVETIVISSDAKEIDAGRCCDRDYEMRFG